VGKVLYVVKATPKGTKQQKALQALGLPVEPQKFAIVEAYRTTEVQGGCKVSHSEPWVKAVAKALVQANLLTNISSFKTLLETVQERATVLRAGKDSLVKLTRRSLPNSGALQELAIPLSSKYESWYHKGNTQANWHVQPVVLIDPRRAKVTVQTKDLKPEVKAALTAVSTALMYFVHTYSMSNLKM
jgi:hypothetical protein